MLSAASVTVLLVEALTWYWEAGSLLFGADVLCIVPSCLLLCTAVQAAC
jgi:hypothetical protein